LDLLKAARLVIEFKADLDKSAFLKGSQNAVSHYPPANGDR